MPGNAQTDLIDSLNQKAYETYRENVGESKIIAYKALKLSQEQNLPSRIVDSYINLEPLFSSGKQA
jgi:hypothetical protein